jgi:hypothetical protein
MANTLTDMIPNLYAALDIVSRELVGLIPAVSRDSSAERAAKGQTVRSPVVPEVSPEDITPGDTPASSGDMTIGSVDMSLSKARAAPVRWTGEEQRSVAQYDQIQTQRFAQAMRALVNEVETDLAGLYTDCSRAHGTAGTTPFGSDLSAMAELLKILKDNGAPTDSLKCVFDTAAGANLRSLTQLTNVNQAGTERTLRDGVLLDIHGFELRESGQIQTQDNSNEDNTGTLKTNSGSLSIGDTSIPVDETGGSDGVKVVAGNYVTINSVKYLVTSGVDLSASGSGTLEIAEPGLVEAVADNTTITQNTDNFVGNMAFAESAVHLATRAPAMPQGGDSADDVMEITDPVSGLAFQVCQYRQYKRVKYEVGLVWGVKAIKPEHMALLLG